MVAAKVSDMLSEAKLKFSSNEVTCVASAVCLILDINVLDCCRILQP
jgi:hypothetical protein